MLERMDPSTLPSVETPTPQTEPRVAWPTQQHLLALCLCLLAGFFLGMDVKSRGGFSSTVPMDRVWGVIAALLVLGGFVLRCVDWKKQYGTLFTLTALAWISWGCFCAVFAGVCGGSSGSANVDGTGGVGGIVGESVVAFLAFGGAHLFGWGVRHPKRALQRLARLSWVLIHLPQLLLNTRRARARRPDGH